MDQSVLTLFKRIAFTGGIFLLANLVGLSAGTVDPFGEFPPWRDPGGELLPFETDAEVLDFLRTAQVVSKTRLSEGINQPYKVLLERDSIQAHAVFRDVRNQKAKIRINGALRLNFRDDYVFEVAAYAVSRLLGLQIVPPTVERVIDGTPGSLQLWVEDAMTETKRRKEELNSPRPLEWARMRQIRYIFDELIHNDDRNLGNSLIDSEWRVWLIDHTRAFHPYARISHRDRLTHIESRLWEALCTTPPETVRDRLRPYLDKEQIEALLARWESLVEHYTDQIERFGEGRVLFSMEQS